METPHQAPHVPLEVSGRLVDRRHSKISIQSSITPISIAVEYRLCVKIIFYANFYNLPSSNQNISIYST